MQQLTERHLIIFVRDRAGRPLNGAKIVFAIAGTAYGEVPSAQGRGDITLPNTVTQPIDVTVSYNGEDKTAKVANGQQSYEFRYDVDTAPTGHLALWVGVALILLAIVLAFVFQQPTPLQTKIIQALLALGFGGFATELTGFLKVDMNWGPRLVVGAGGALAVFVILWFTNASL